MSTVVINVADGAAFKNYDEVLQHIHENVIRSIISTLLFSIVVMYLGGYVAPGATQFLHGAGVGLQGQGTDFVLTGPWEVLTYWLSTVFR